MWHADAHFRMGTSHEAEGSPCQDYAVADNGAMPFAIVSDGCSTSGRTDIGSRLWCLAALDFRRYRTPHWDPVPSDLISSSITALKKVRREIGVRDTDLDATLGAVFTRHDGRLRGLLFGDGVLAVKAPDWIEINVVEWAGNMPGYPSYLMTAEKYAAFIEQSRAFAGEDAWPCVVTTIRLGIDGTRQSTSATGYSASGGLYGIGMVWDADTEIAMVMTDGVGQVSGLDLPTVVTELLSFGPARQGAFAKRKLNGALKRWAKDGHRPVDDISIAALVRADV